MKPRLQLIVLIIHLVYMNVNDKIIEHLLTVPSLLLSTAEVKKKKKNTCYFCVTDSCQLSHDAFGCEKVLQMCMCMHVRACLCVCVCRLQQTFLVGAK